MPRKDLYGQGIQSPVLGDAPDIEEATKGIVDGIVPKTIMRFANANARSAALSGATAPVPGMVTYLIAEDRFDRRDGDNVWRPLSPGPWKPFSFASGYSAHTGAPAYRIINGEVQLRGVVRRTNGADLVLNTETSLGTLPAEARPTAWRYFLAPTQFTNVSGVSYFSARIGVAPDGTINYIMPLKSSSNWIGLDVVRFSLD
ncbi:hypothetical protein SAM23877_6118 [Streptomyces ambofaciens ATCC 23877]|uniref:Uncharacterized protein n=1 Tax=Streptomyces ambofaciens (strain ATCC 23877 / 3486 / DSM 40053 / JCM 4204 / NBRC 12836 / NRRL B-2516) TaxID=278992 RepID=A0A0K2B1T1_STRA7|nr:hypothetical protein [Streptomyces ambofaciens]AKZ59163.1 hypothetical protein SAM23877_6118 [Streptomyces ambofaciens ATCC 23877]WNA15356.1 tail protein [Streptomyces phage Samy]